MNKYDQVKVLGQGGFGKALLVKRKTDNVQFVIKEVRLTSLTPKDREEALKEVKVLASLKHPYIVEYVESFQERGCLFIVMGYADGGDLAQKIEKAGRKLFSEDEILHDFIEIALGIKYIHDRKILHRDLKGQNVFLMKDGTVKLGDFGIARVLEHTFQVCKTQIGTPYYLSPEICQGKNYNMKTDIWSLGCILYELCTLKHAFEAGNMNQLLMNIIRGRYTPIPAQYSEDLKNLVNRMLTKEPEKRPNINQILATPFIKERLAKFLDKTMLDYEMQHTVLHGRKPFAAPTIIPKKQPLPTVAAGNAPSDDHCGFTKKRDEQNKKMAELEKRQKELDEKVRQREAELKKKEEELRKKQEQQRIENEKRDAEIKKMEADLARREKEEKEKIAAKELEIKKQQQRIAQIEVEKRDAELKHQESLIMRREREEQARLEAREKQIQQQARQNNGQDEFDRRAAEIKRRQEELERRGREERARLDAQEKQLQQMKIDQERRYQEMQKQIQQQRKEYQHASPQPQPQKYQQQPQNNQQQDRAAYEKKQREAQERAAYEKKQREAQDRAAYEKKQREAQERAAYEKKQREYEEKKQRLEQEKLDAEKRARQNEWEERNRLANQNRARDRGGPFAYDNPPAAQQRKPAYDQPRKDPYNRNEGNMTDDERRRIFFEQQQAAAANRARVRNDGGGIMDCFNYNEPEPRNNNRNNNNNRRDKQSDEDAERMRIYMEQRREAMANKERQRNMEMRGNAVMDAICDPHADEDERRERNRRAAEKQKKLESEEEERRRIFMEQRRAALANRDRMRQMEMGGGEARDAIMRNDDDDDYEEERRRRNQKKQKNDLDDDERRRIFMEQKRAAQANRDRMRQMEMGGGEARDAIMRNDDDDYDDRNRRNNNKKKEYDEEAMKEFYRQQRHEARANREKLRQAEYGTPDYGKEEDNHSDSNSSSHRHHHRHRRHHRDGSESSDNGDNSDRNNGKKKQMSIDEINAYMREQRHIAQANKARAQAAEAESQFERDLKENAKNDDPLPQKKKEMGLDEINAYMREQRHIARANKAKAQAAEAESQFERDLKENAKDDDPLPQKKKDMSLEEINAYMREQRHIARANKAKAQAAEAESQFEKDLKENAKDDDPLPQKKKEMGLDEINAYMREQRHIARANKAKAQAAEAESQFEKDLKENAKDDEPLPQKKKDMSLEEINAYMREQRHIARANKAKAQAAEAESQFEKDLKENAKDDEPLPQKKKEMGLDEINAYMREQRHIARANKARAQAAEAESQLEKDLKENAKDDEPLPQKKKDMSLEEINAYMREQRHIARANREKAERAELGGPDKDAKPDEDSDSPPPQKEKKPEMSLAEINAFMREQRHARRANRARAEAEANGTNMDKLIAQAEAEQRANPRIDADDKNQPPPPEEDDEPPPQKEKKPEMSLAEINAFMREQRHARRANRARAEAELQGVNMDQLIANAEAEQRAHPKLDAADSAAPAGSQPPPPEEDDEPPPQKEKKPEMSLAEINAFMREQRHARRANRARAEAELQGVNMDQLIANAEAEQRAHPKLDADKGTADSESKDQPPPEEDDEPPPQKEKKPEMSLAEINAFMREQRHARRANRARAEAELQGIDMNQLIADAEAEQRANPKLVDPQENAKPATPPQKQQPPPQPKPQPKPEPKPQQQQPPPSSEPAGGQPQRMTVAEARRQAMAKKKQQQPQPQQQPQQSQPQQQQKQPETQKQQQEQEQQQPQQLLDKAAMRELFAQQRNEMRLNRERIKAAQDGSRDPNLPSTMQSQNSRRPPPKQQPQPQQVPKVPIQSSSRLSSGSDKGNPLKNSARRIIQNSDSARSSPSNTGQLQKQLQSKGSKLVQPTIPVDYDSYGSGSDDGEPAGISGRLDMSQALNSKSASNFLKSRSIVLKTLGKDDLANEDLQDQIADENEDAEIANEEQKLEKDEEKNSDEKAATKHLSEILDKAKFLNDALNLNEGDLEDNDDDENVPAANDKDGTKKIQTNKGEIDNAPQFFLQNKVLNLPVVHDSDSLSYRAEAIRVFLEKEIGLDKLIELKQAVADSDSTSVDVGKILNNAEPGVVVLAQQLLILDEACDQ